MIKICQREAFSNELKQIKKGASVARGNHLSKLTPYIDEEGLLRSRSRLQNVSWLSKEFKCPIILPKAHPLSLLIIRSVHEEFEHPLGRMAAINELNKRMWIIGLRPMLKRIQDKCAKCRIDRAKPVQPIMGDLPKYRFETPGQAFRVTSIDFAGPFITKASRRGMSRNKRYVSLFSCLQTRAVHLEMTTSLETSSFLNAFSRFSDRRGTPAIIVTDNGGTFVKAEREIRSRMMEDEDKIIGTSHTIQWSFLPPYASNLLVFTKLW